MSVDSIGRFVMAVVCWVELAHIGNNSTSIILWDLVESRKLCFASMFFWQTSTYSNTQLEADKVCQPLERIQIIKIFGY